jgi:hypothetical protein
LTIHVPVITLVARTLVNRMRRAWPLLRRPTPLWVVICCSVASAASAQSALTGIVHDPSGRVAAGAIVRVTDVATGTQKYETFVSSIGYFEIELPAGDYKVEASLGPLSYSGTIRVYPQEKTAFDVTLEARVGSVRETVIGTTSAADAFGPSAATGATFSKEEINTLPLQNGRTVQSFQSLVPGLVFTDSNGSQAQFTAVGQRRFSNRLTIDGVSADLAIDISNFGITEGETGTLPAVSTLGGTQTLVPLAAIEEIHIKTTETSAADAKSPGAQTIIVTRAGGDRFAGNAFTDVRPEGLGASDWFAKSTTDYSAALKKPASSQNFGATAGGPAIPQRVFYFAAWEHQRVNRPVRLTSLVPSLETRKQADSSVQPLLAAFPEPNGPDATDPELAGLAEFSDDYPVASTLSSYSLRVDANLSPRHRLFGRANVGRSSGDTVNGLQVPSAFFSNIESTRTKTATVGLTSAFSSFVSNEARVSASTNSGWISAVQSSHIPSGEFPRSSLLPTNDSQLPLAADASPWISLTVTGFQGLLYSGKQLGSKQEQLQFVDTLSLSRGHHEFRAGVDASWQTASTTPPPDVYAYRIIPSNVSLLGRTTLTLQHNVPTRVRFARLALFAEDTFRVSKHFSLGYGVRYNIEPAPSNLTDTEPLIYDADVLPDAKERPAGTPLWKTSWSNIAPRVSAAYQIGSGTNYETTLRASWNLGFDEIWSASANVFGANYPYVSRRVAAVTVFPVPAEVLDTPTPARFAPLDCNTYYASPETFRTPRVYSWQVGVDQSLGRFQRLSVAYVGTAGRDQSYWYSSNVAGQTAVRVNAFSNDGQSDYHAMLAEYVWRLSHGLQAQVSYAWSHAIDIDSGERGLITSVTTPRPSLLSPRSSRGSADFDRRHVLQTVASYQLPPLAGPWLLRTLGADWQVDAVLAFRSGAPFTVTSVRDIGFGQFNYRADPVAGFPVWITDRTAPGGQRLNPYAFETPAEPRQGMLGRNTLRASPLRQVDLGLSRVIRLGDRMTARLRFEAFNVFNIPNFGSPLADVQISQEQFGRPFQSYANALGTGTLSGGGLVPLQQVGGPRSVQIGIRVTF